MPAMSQSRPCLWTRLPQSSQAPCDRYKHACCSYDGHVYILGGRDDSYLKDFWRYSVVCNEWTEIRCSSEASPEELEEHSMVAHKGVLYVFGGMLDCAYNNDKCALRVFDIAKQQWVSCQGKTGALQGQMPTNRKGHSAVVVGSVMLVYGGLEQMIGSSQEFWSLDFYTMTWSLLSNSQQSSLSPGPRHSHSAIASNNCMYLFGGLKGLREQKDFWRWDSSSYTWTSLRTRSGPSRLFGHSAVAYKDAMFLFGGGESHHFPSNCLWRYSFITHTWGQIATIPGSNPPEKIHHCCIGLGPCYNSDTNNPSSSSGRQPRLLHDKPRPFKNKCFPAPFTFIGTEEAIELETFSPNKCNHCKTLTETSDLDNSKEGLMGKQGQQNEYCLTFENKAFNNQCICTEDDQLGVEDSDIVQHLPDIMLVFGGRPCTRYAPISIWQMTVAES